MTKTDFNKWINSISNRDFSTANSIVEKSFSKHFIEKNYQIEQQMDEAFKSIEGVYS
jgi:hypothetical protein